MPSNIDAEASWANGWKEISSLGSGFVVWESNRTGRWRIWTRSLDGSGLRQLSPEEKNRDHFCPHISPDGKKIVYISYPVGVHGYMPIPKGQKTYMRIMNSNGSGDRVLVEGARAYFEHRGAVWVSDEELIYIGAEGASHQINIKSRQSTRITKEAHKEYGWLINPTKTYATSGWPQFSPYDSSKGAISHQQPFGGCQPYFTRDGVWGFWMSRTGEIGRVHLATRKQGVIVRKGDNRLPKARNYTYFPMISSCGRLFAFGASPNQHDHHTADYDIFVSRIDSSKMELIGEPVRYSFHKGVDRYPDVFVADLELGTHYGEAPHAIDFTLKDMKGEWDWNFGDGKTIKGAAVKHTFTKAGEYTIEAKQGNRTIRGRAIISPANPPKALTAALRGDRDILVVFDEPVNLKGLKASLESKVKITGTTPGADGRSVTINLAAKPTGQDKLRLDGVYDLAQKPNKMAPQIFEISSPTWPTNKDGLVFLWETGDKPNLVRDVKTGKDRTYSLKSRGLVRLNRDYAMLLAGGAYLVEGADENLLAACKKSNALSIEATVIPYNLEQAGPARIVSFSTDAVTRNFTLGQERNKLILRLRTTKNETGFAPQLDLCELVAGKPNHIIVSYTPGQLVCYLNGKQVLKTDRSQGNLSNWVPHHLLFGDEWNGERDWAGRLEGVAIYSRAIGKEEAARNYTDYSSVISSRKNVPFVELEAQIIARSKRPTLKEISPYREALAVDEYEVKKVISGKCSEKRIRVAHWAVMDGKNLPEGQKGTVRLVLEPFEANPQLQSIYLADTLQENFDLSLYYDVRK